MRDFLTHVFTWWNGWTYGTKLWTSRFGEKVGTDEFGNVYYRTRGGKVDPTLGFQRRWVIYNGPAEASTIPAGWHGWMHHRVDTPPSEQQYVPRPWQLPAQANQTGTPAAYRPSGSILKDAQRPAATGAYDAWTPRR